MMNFYEIRGKEKCTIHFHSHKIECTKHHSPKPTVGDQLVAIDKECVLTKEYAEVARLLEEKCQNQSCVKLWFRKKDSTINEDGGLVVYDGGNNNSNNGDSKEKDSDNNTEPSSKRNDASSSSENDNNVCGRGENSDSHGSEVNEHSHQWQPLPYYRKQPKMQPLLYQQNHASPIGMHHRQQITILTAHHNSFLHPLIYMNKHPPLIHKQQITNHLQFSRNNYLTSNQHFNDSYVQQFQGKQHTPISRSRSLLLREKQYHFNNIQCTNKHACDHSPSSLSRESIVKKQHLFHNDKRALTMNGNLYLDSPTSHPTRNDDVYDSNAEEETIGIVQSRTATTTCIHTNDNPNAHRRTEEDKEWLQILHDNPKAKVYRLRQFVADCKGCHDKCGNLPSLWAIEKGYIASEARLFPNHVETSKSAFDFLQQPLDDIILSTHDSSSWRNIIGKCEQGRRKTYCNTYIKFACIKRGDVIALQVRSRRPKKGVFYFGIVESDDVILQTVEQVMHDGFPSPKLFEKTIFDCGRIMLKKVRWMRKASARSLPFQSTSKKGANYVNWLSESGVVIWITEVTSHGALKKLTSEEFLSCSEALNTDLV
uniref:Uncharacterized protein n=2 Tax=Ditylum brightwellii TaxID=49249 RepID=A0A7S4VUH2_9STRA